MIDIFMLIMIIILAVVLLVISLYLLVYYCHPDDAGFGSGLVCKIFAILGLSVCWAQVLLFPLDVSNTRGTGDIWNYLYDNIIDMGSSFSSLFDNNPKWKTSHKRYQYPIGVSNRA